MSLPSPHQQSLLDAIHDHDLDAVEAALARGADLNRPDAEGWTPLIHAARFGSADIFDRLIAWGADPARPDPFGWSAWAHAVDSGDPDRRSAALAHRTTTLEARP